MATKIELSCADCDASCIVRHDMDDTVYSAVFCPFCGYEMYDDEIDFDDFDEENEEFY